MAHEELKKLYEIDNQHSGNARSMWQFRGSESGTWQDIVYNYPMWFGNLEYRRKPDAPVWDAKFADMLYQRKRSAVEEDARKWRELVAYYESDEAGAPFKVVDRLLKLLRPQPPLIQGYTSEQWQAIIDGQFLCEFSDVSNFDSEENSIGFLLHMGGGFYTERFGNGSEYFEYCRPLRLKGHRQPWFGGECPVDPDSKVSITMRDGHINASYDANDWNWKHCDVDGDIVEFIEL